MTRQSTPKGLRRLLRNQTGMAAVEFALIVPILLLAYLGATDITQALAIDRKLSQVASTVSDLVAQEKTIDDETVEAFFQSGIAIMRPFDFENTKLRLTIVEVDDGSTKVTGLKDHNWPPDIGIGDSMALPEDMLELAEGRYLVVASASYEYQPMFATIFNASIGLEQRSMHVVRQAVENFGLKAHGSSPSAPGRGSEDESGGTGEGSEDEENCAGNSGGHGRGANCENDNNSHGSDRDGCFGYNCDRDDNDDRGGRGGGHGDGRGGGWDRH